MICNLDDPGGHVAQMNGRLEVASGSEGLNVWNWVVVTEGQGGCHRPSCVVREARFEWLLRLKADRLRSSTRRPASLGSKLFAAIPPPQHWLPRTSFGSAISPSIGDGFGKGQSGSDFGKSCRLQTGEDGSNRPVPLQVRFRRAGLSHKDHMTNHLHIITGGPGPGRMSLIDALAAEGLNELSLFLFLFPQRGGFPVLRFESPTGGGCAG